MQSCVDRWEIFDVPIAPTWDRKEHLVHYGKIALSNIKSYVKNLNTANGRQYQEDKHIYMCLMVPLTQ